MGESKKWARKNGWGIFRGNLKRSKDMAVVHTTKV